jgi:hypothetical protein
MFYPPRRPNRESDRMTGPQKHQPAVPLWPGRDVVSEQMRAKEREIAAAARPSVEPSAARRNSEVVRVLPGYTEETVIVTSYRGNGRPFIRIELPADLAPAWIDGLERYTIKHDKTRRGLRLLGD